MPLNEALRDKTAGPRPITIDQYRERNKKTLTILPTRVNSEFNKKPRGGADAKLREDIKNLYRLVKIAVTKEEKANFNKQIKLLKIQRKTTAKEKRAKRVEKTNNLFDKIFKTIEENSNYRQ